MRGRAAPPQPGIHRVPPPPREHVQPPDTQTQKPSGKVGTYSPTKCMSENFRTNILKRKTKCAKNVLS